MDDKEICDLLLCNTEQGMYELIAKYNSYVRSITGRVLLNCHQDIEECVADTFISIWKNKESLNTNSGNIKGLLACIARNTAINRYKHIKKEQFLDIECENLVAEDEIESLIENIYQDEVVNLMLNVLKEHHKEIFIRRHILMETIKEISKDMDIDERQVRNSLYQSKIKLQKSLVQESIVMKKELFNAIGEIEVKTGEKIVKSEIDRTYAMVMKKIHYDERKHRKKKIIVSIITVSISVAAVIGIFVLSKNSTINTHLDNSEQIIEEKEDKFNKMDVVVYVYEAQNKSQPVTSLYASEMVKREVKADTKVYLGSYDPLMSSVPGYPIIVSNDSSNGSEQSEGNLIRIEVDKGNLIIWDKNTNKTTEVGNLKAV